MPPPTERSSLRVKAERAVLAAVRLPESTYDHADPFGELKSLAEQGGAVVVGEMSQNLPRPVAATFMGKGKLEELKAFCLRLNAGTVIFDHDLSPKQIANIEKVVERKVIDRSELILDIFASRATSTQAKLQVELAQLQYTYPRLRAMWTHLERIVGSGGIGGLGTRGPGEQQLEIDRRLAQDRQTQLRRQIEELQERKAREVRQRKLEHTTVGLVGYTNAGKSTLFNTLTAGGAYADDRLFATLMTRTRRWDVGEGAGVMLSDTVGFVRDLPHDLIAAFKATLEEATHADLLLVVLDVSDRACELQHETVERTLDELFEEIPAAERRDGWKEPRRVLLLNKADRLSDRELGAWEKIFPHAIPICALPPGPGEDLMAQTGMQRLHEIVRDLARGEVREYALRVPLADARAVTAVERSGEVLGREYDAEHVTLRVRLGERQLAPLLAGGAVQAGPGKAARRAGAGGRKKR